MMMPNIESILERLKKVLNVSSDSELARILNIGRQTLGNWKSRGTIPYTECLHVSLEKDISLEWLLTGEGQMHKSRTTPILREESAHYGSSRQLTPREEAVLKMFNSLTEDEKRDIQKSLEEKKRLADIEEKVKHLTKELAEVKKGA